jgi:Tol biopolymer transport system component/predicted Ser/Thr protein kinase
MVGASLGHFRILRELGKGGMGEVYLAEDTKLGRQVALKVLPEEITQDRERRGRFQREARAVAALNHSHIVTVHSVEEIEGRDVLVLEYVRGKTLAEAIPRGGLSLAPFLEIAIPLTDAVAAAHRQGVIHRDLKPRNVMLDHEGRVKVLDFGLARVERGSSANGPTATTSAANLVSTEEGRILGTVAYMSPEQLEGRPVDHRTDIFSLGILLYELSTGRRPFQGESQASVISAILRDEPPSVTELKADLPRHLARILRLCLAKDPERRYQTALDVRNELVLLKEETESGGIKQAGLLKSERSESRRRSGLVVAAAVVVLAALAILVWPTVKERVAPIDSGETADGTLRGTIRRLTYSGTANVPLWSPDGRTIAYVDEEGTKLVPAAGGPSRLLLANAICWNWKPDGSGILGFSLESGTPQICEIGLFGEEPKILQEAASFPALSPDGRFLAYAARGDSGGTGIWILDLETGTREFLLKPFGLGTTSYKPQWSRDGGTIAYSRWNGEGHELWIYDRATGEDRQIESAVHPGGHFDWSTDGEYIVTGGILKGTPGIWKLPIEGGDPVRLTQSADLDDTVSLAPDGTALVFARHQPAGRIDLVDLVTGERTSPEFGSAVASDPTYSHDGSRLFFQVYVNGDWQLWYRNLEVDSKARPIIAPTGVSAFGAVASGDGRLAHLRADHLPVSVFGAIEWPQTLWVGGEDGGGIHQVESAGDHVSRIAAGGFRAGWLIAVYEESGRESLHFVREDDSTIRLLQENESFTFAGFDWGPSENEILIVHSTPESGTRCHALSIVEVPSGKRRALCDLDSLFASLAVDHEREVSGLCASPDGEQIALAVFSRTARTHETCILDLDARSIRVLQRYESNELPGRPAWSPDGTTLAISRHWWKDDIFVLEGIDL